MRETAWLTSSDCSLSSLPDKKKCLLMTGSESKLKKPWDFRNDRLEWVEKLVLRALNSEVMGCEGREWGEA